jgi:DNA-binding transcriptional regulator YiaG
LAKREEIPDAFEKSGLSGVAFAALTGVKCPTLANWIQRRRDRRLSREAGP